jgi:hypothetical protein
VETAIEPGAGVVKCDCLEGSKRGRVSVVPYLPKGLVVCAGVKEDGQLVNVMDDPVPKKEIAQDVKREIAKVVGGTKTGKRQTIDLSHCAPLPEEPSLRDTNARDTLVPEAEMQFDSKRHLRIERVPFPLPVAKPNQSCYMIGPGVTDS